MRGGKGRSVFSCVMCIGGVSENRVRGRREGLKAMGG